MTYIYALFSGRDGAVRYVGQTIASPERRFDQHRHGPYLGSSVVRSWMYGEWRESYPVRIETLEWCERSRADERETYWINLFDNLINERKYYRPQIAPQYRTRTPKISAITSYMQNHTFHVDGRHGIHYRHSVDSFFVLVPDRDGVRCLPGDELPGGSGAVWFSDLARAMNAAISIETSLLKPSGHETLLRKRASCFTCHPRSVAAILAADFLTTTHLRPEWRASLPRKQLVQLPALRPIGKNRKRPLPGDLLRGLHEAGPGHAGQRAADADTADAERGQMLHGHGRLDGEHIERLAAQRGHQRGDPCLAGTW